jgi:pimeloyl-ACP methyl ester carboxylesterase
MSSQVAPKVKSREELLRGLFGRASATETRGNLVTLRGPDPFGCEPSMEVCLKLYGKLGRKRALVLLSPFGGLTPLDRMLARESASLGLSVAAVNHITGDHDVDPAWNVHERGLVRGVAAIRRSLDWLACGGSEEFSVFGSSMGALHAATAACLFEEISRTALIAAGAPIWKIAARSEQHFVRKMREARLSRGMYSEREYEARLQEALPLDLLEMARPREGRKDLLFLGKRDTAVPYSTQQCLASLLCPAKLHTLPFGHYGTIVSGMLFYRREIAEHLAGL